MNKKLLQLYGLKWNPFSAEIPTEALVVSPKLEHFGWRVENLVREGGFALITGDPGTGKSAALRLLSERLGALRDVGVGVVEHPQSGVSDFYRELGHLFGVSLAPRNRWGGFKALRDKWHAHIEQTLLRPVLFIDEVQEMSAQVLMELRLLMSAQFDSRSLLTVVLAGDGRLVERLQSDELLPLTSRVRARLVLERKTPAELEECLRHALQKAGAPKLITPELVATLAEHASGNPRALMTMAAELLAAAAQCEVRQIDEKLFLEVFAAPPPAEAKASAQGRRR
ncbi:MAG: AAA family ATPase [Deltaproteobacteria bacterium]|nr:AAA family ATPase [Deltaproteobacteria bacterium]